MFINSHFGRQSAHARRERPRFTRSRTNNSDPDILYFSTTNFGQSLFGRRHIVLSSIGGLSGFLAGCAIQTTDVTDTTSSELLRNIRLIGHRGCANQYPENTVHAVKQSAPHVDMIEVDVQRCGSGELVVFHDDDLDRLTDSTGPVAATNWDVLKDLTILDSDETIPRLSDILAAVPPETPINIELKHGGMAEDLVSITDEYENPIHFSSFSPSALREIRKIDEDATLAFLLKESPMVGLSIAADLGCVAVNPSVDLVLGSNVVQKAHESGFEVNVWTVDRPETARKLIEADVDGLFVNRWDILGK